MLALLLLHGSDWVYVVIIAGILYYLLAVPVAALLLFQGSRASLRVPLGPLGLALGGLAAMSAFDGTASGDTPLLLYTLPPLGELLVAGYMRWRLTHPPQTNE